MSSSKFEYLCNQEAQLAPNQSEKYSRSISNAYYTLAASANRKRKRIPSKIIRVYTASKMSSGNSQLGPFSEGLLFIFINFPIEQKLILSDYFGPATKMLRLKEKGYQIEYLTVADIRERFVTWIHPSFLVDWLLESDFHFILCQGIHSQMFGIWSPSDCVEELKRLEYHNGFPSGKNLHDPVFNGDKFEYLCALSEYCNPSFKIPLDIIVQSKEVKEEILDKAKEFLIRFIKYDGDSQKGFILKAPFVQNKQGFPLYHFTTFEQLVSKINSCYVKESTAFGKLHLKDADVFPYLIIQPRMVSTAESKVVLWNGVAQYVCITPGRIGIMKKAYNISKSDLFKYVEDACAKLKEETNGAFISEGLTRVDCFCLSNGKIVVNEVESLDANFSGKSDSESLTSTFLVNYYCKVIESKLI